jgi:CRP-like cAMP-binding protein
MVRTVHSSIPPLGSGDLFAGLSRAGRSRLDSISRPHLASRGDSVFEPGAPPAIWILEAGEAVLCAAVSGDDVEACRAVATGEVLGLMEALAQVPFSAKLTAVSDCRFTHIERLKFVQLLRAEPSLRAKLLTLIAEANIIARRGETGR